MNDTPSTPQQPAADKTTLIRHFLAGPLGRCVLIIAITLLLQIPLGLVENLADERKNLYTFAADSIADEWGKTQTVSGPLLVIPYEVWEDRTETVPETVERIINERTVKEVQHVQVLRRYYNQHYKIVLPAQVHFAAALDTEVRYRGIYRQTLYSAPVSVRGNFILPGADDFGDKLWKVHWDRAWLAVGMTDLKGIVEVAPLRWGKETASHSPGARLGNILGPGFHAPVPLTEKAAGSSWDFALDLKIRGSGGIFFTPVGKNSVISLSSPWPAPSFQGAILPAERHIRPEGFSAKWNISNLTRDYPQTGSKETFLLNGRSAILGFTVGVDLYETVSLYRMTMRAAHYAILFIAASFVALFAFEMAIGRRLHLLQYGMVGLSLSVFYLVLLSLAEHIGFGRAFAVAAALTTAMNSLYVAAVLRSKARGLIMAVLLAGLYGLLFSLLRMEDTALLAGTALVVVMLGALMFVTRRLPQSRASA